MMEIIHVEGSKTINEFHELPYRIYRNDNNWVPPIRKMVEDIFNQEKNVRLNNGKACRWLLKKNGLIIGRIAAFYEKAYSTAYEQPTGGVGFFECINDQLAADKLFDTAKSWLSQEGMEAMDGPINLGENFFNWGLLVDGFQQQGYGMQYHPTYYQQLFSNYGFQEYYKQYSYHLNVTSPDLPERFWKIAAWVAKKPDYSFVPFSFKEEERCIRDFIEIHKKAWRNHDNYKEITPDDLKTLIRESKQAIEEDFIWYVYHKEKPVAFFMMIPDMNQILKHIKNGKLTLLNMLKFLFLRKTKTINRCRVLVMGVVPQFQKSGLESGIFYQIRQVLLKKHWYNELELSWVGDFNPKMVSLFNSVGGKHVKTHATLRYLFDREKPFQRLMAIE